MRAKSSLATAFLLGLSSLLAAQATQTVPPAPAGERPGRSKESGQKDRIVLKTGTVIVGRIQARSRDEITFDIEGKGTVDLPRTRIRAVQPHGLDQGIYGIAPPAENTKGNDGKAANRSPQSYVLYAKGKRKAGVKGTLSTGVTRWYHAKSETTLFLVGAVHIGEQSYFDRVQGILDHTDVVLFESVRKGKVEMSPEEAASMTALGKMQLAMKDALGLEFQKSAMSYDRDFWKNADVDWASLQDAMKKNNARLPTDNPLMRGLLGLVSTLISTAKENERAHDLLRGQLAPVLAQADKILATQMKGISSSLIIFRNEKAMKCVREELENGTKGRWLSLFYGAAHLPDLDQRLRTDGWKLQGTDWVTAWKFTGR